MMVTFFSINSINLKPIVKTTMMGRLTNINIQEMSMTTTTATSMINLHHLRTTTMMDLDLTNQVSMVMNHTNMDMVSTITNNMVARDSTTTVSTEVHSSKISHKNLGLVTDQTSTQSGN